MKSTQFKFITLNVNFIYKLYEISNIYYEIQSRHNHLSNNVQRIEKYQQVQTK